MDAGQGIANSALTKAGYAAGSRGMLSSAAARPCCLAAPARSPARPPNQSMLIWWPGRGAGRRRKQPEANVKLGIVSDIHCNAAGLRAALALMGDVDELICLGDSIWEYR